MFYSADKKYLGVYAGKDRISVVLFTKENPFLDFEPLDSDDQDRLNEHLQEHHKKQNTHLRRVFKETDSKLSEFFQEQGGLNGKNGYSTFIGDDQYEIEVFFEKDEEARADYMKRMGYNHLVSGFVFSFSDEVVAHPEKFPVAAALKKHLEENYYWVSKDILDDVDEDDEDFDDEDETL